jgi:hypothetical protein
LIPTGRFECKISTADMDKGNELPRNPTSTLLHKEWKWKVVTRKAEHKIKSSHGILFSSLSSVADFPESFKRAQNFPRDYCDAARDFSFHLTTRVGTEWNIERKKNV